MSIKKGMSLGPYEIVCPIGEGGMGQVWRARDGRIGRDVAVKVLRGTGFAKGDEQLWRFEQEARAVGALNHPGLVTIFDIGTTDGSPYIVMELLEGETLRDAIGDEKPVALPLRKAIDYAIQICSALAVAHEQGVIHRDLKPENIFVTSDGRLKILDFGLAKLAPEATEADSAHRTAKHVTSAGFAVGTPGYMSPEQVRAQTIDRRTDIFSFGAVLYEMLTARPAFLGSSAVETMYAVLNTEPPPLSDVKPGTPPTIEAIVAHCLEKNPRDRFQSARDLAFQLQMLPEAQRGGTGSRPLQVRSKPRVYRAAAIVLPLLLAGAGAGFLLRGVGAHEPQPIPRTFRQLTFGDGVESFPAFAPDGKSFAYVSSSSGNADIYLQRVDGRLGINLTKDSPDDDSEPAFSPDGSQIAFRSERDGGGIFVMGATGESPHRVANFGHTPTWSPDGTRIAVSTEGIGLRPHVRPLPGELWVIDTRTEAARRLLPAQAGGDGRTVDAVQPSWSTHGNRIAFWGISPYPAGDRHVWTIDPDAPHPEQTLVRATSEKAFYWNPVWSPDGRYLYFGSDRDGTLNLWRMAIDPATGKTSGAAEPLSLPASFSGHFSFSQHGEVAYTSVAREYRLLAFPFDSQTATTGPPRQLFGGTQEILSFEPSPSMREVAFTTGGPQEDLFLANVDTGRFSQLTNDAARDRGVTWAPDGKTLYLYSNRDGPYNVWSIRADGSGLARITDDADLKRHGGAFVVLPNASPDGRTLVAQSDTANLFIHLDRPIASRFEPVGNQQQLSNVHWSPDGTRILGDVSVRAGFAIYEPATHHFDEGLELGVASQWLPDGRRIVFFQRNTIGIFNLDSRAVITAPFPSPIGVQLNYRPVPPRLSRDGSTLYVRQLLEQGDVWLMRLPNEKPAG